MSDKYLTVISAEDVGDFGFPERRWKFESVGIVGIDCSCSQSLQQSKSDLQSGLRQQVMTVLVFSLDRE